MDQIVRFPHLPVWRRVLLVASVAIAVCWLSLVLGAEPASADEGNPHDASLLAAVPASLGVEAAAAPVVEQAVHQPLEAAVAAVADIPTDPAPAVAAVGKVASDPVAPVDLSDSAAAVVPVVAQVTDDVAAVATSVPAVGLAPVDAALPVDVPVLSDLSVDVPVLSDVPVLAAAGNVLNATGAITVGTNTSALDVASDARRTGVSPAGSLLLSVPGTAPAGSNSIDDPGDGPPGDTTPPVRVPAEPRTNSGPAGAITPFGAAADVTSAHPAGVGSRALAPLSSTAAPHAAPSFDPGSTPD